MKQGMRSLVIFALFVLCAAALPVHALAPHESPGVERLLPQGPEAISKALDAGAGTLSPEDAATAARSLEALREATGVRWRALAWNPVTLTPRLVAGEGMDLGGSVGSAGEAEALARRFVRQTRALWGLDPRALATDAVRHGLGKWSVQFQQTLDGRRVLGSRLIVLMTESGRLAAFGGDLWPRLQAPTQPLLSEAAAARIAIQELARQGAVGSDARLQDATLGILPASATEGFLVYRLRILSPSVPAAWLVDVDARDGRIHQIQDVLRTADFSGTVLGLVEDPDWCAGFSELALPLMVVEVAGVGQDTTDAAGGFLIPYAGTQPETLRARFFGPYVDVNNTDGPDALWEAVVDPGTPVPVNWDTINSRHDERDVFYHTNATHEFLKAVDPSWSDLDYPLPANVNIDAACNAFWDGESINFFRESGTCANTGRIGDVVAHEYGHGVTDFLYGDNDPPGDLHEGNSDVLGNYLTDNSVIGHGFYLDDCEGGLRDSDNDLVWPDDLTGEGHADGRIIAGFHWDIWEALKLSLGEEAGKARAAQIWHFARALGLPLTQPEQVWWTFLADDDDGNLDNGTPNHADICAAAQHHGFDCPEVFDAVVIHHTAHENSQAPDGQPIVVEAVIYSFADDMNPDSILVYYREHGDAGPFNSVAMYATGEPDVYRGEIPNFPVATLVDYYIYAADLSQNHLTDPRDAPVRVHTTRVVTVFDPFEQASEWTVGEADDDATQGIWEVADPVGVTLTYPVQPEDDATPDPGRFCWITGQYDGGYPWYSDADGKTTLLSPIYDLSAYDWVVMGYALWFQSGGSAAGYLDVDVSSDGGLTWVNVDHVEGFHPDAHWTRKELNLSGSLLNPGLFRVRVRMFGQPNPSVDEAGFDDFVLMAGTGNPAGASEPRQASADPRLRLLSRLPMTRQATWLLELPRPAAVSLRILDVRGRVVRELASGTLRAGSHEVRWDGRDGRGTQVASGLYFLHSRVGSQSETRRVVVLR
jgi:hypothetical protein